MSEQAEKIAQAEESLQSARLKARDFWMAYQQALKEVDDAEQVLIEARKAVDNAEQLLIEARLQVGEESQ